MASTSERKIASGTSGADETFMSDADYAAVQQYREQFNQAQANGDQAGMDAAHAGAEAVRAKYEYSGGADGSKFLPYGDATGFGPSNSGSSSRNTTTSSTQSSGTSYGSNIETLRSALDQWKTQATAQASAEIDYGVQTAVDNLQRALEDAQPQFREQAESVSRDERQGMDNSALYSELRGDKGGIGQSQYNEIQAAAAQNRLAVQQAQTQLSTDTARQIEDLRAQGEFAKADAALQISQSYLSQLMGMEQWAAEYNLSAAQFEASLEQWQAEYQLSMQELAQNQSQFNANLQLSYDKLTQSQNQFDTTTQLSYDKLTQDQSQFDTTTQLSYDKLAQDQSQFDVSTQLSYDELAQEREKYIAQLTGQFGDGTQTLSYKKQLSSEGWAKLKSGLMPTSTQLAAMGVTASEARQYIWLLQVSG